MDKWAELNAFVAVAEHGGFAPAARALHVAPSGVSRLIANLEGRLGVRLLSRTTRRVSLTEAGERLYARGRDVLDGFDEAEADVIGLQSIPRGVLRIACVVTLAERWMAPIVADFMQRYPEVSVELIETDRPVDLAADGIDVALVTGSLPDSSNRVRRLSDFHRLVVASPDYLERHGTPETPADLARHNCLAFAGAPHLQRWTFRGTDGKLKSRSVKGTFSASGAETVLRAAVAGIGLCRLASFMVAPHIRSSTLLEVLGEYKPADPVPLHAMFGPGQHLSPKIRVFIDHLSARFTPIPPWDDDGDGGRGLSDRGLSRPAAPATAAR